MLLFNKVSGILQILLICLLTIKTSTTSSSKAQGSGLDAVATLTSELNNNQETTAESNNSSSSGDYEFSIDDDGGNVHGDGDDGSAQILENLEDDELTVDDDDEEYEVDEEEILSEPVRTSDDLAKLRKSLLTGYDMKSRPIADSSTPFKVYLRVHILQINGLDEIYQVRINMKTLIYGLYGL
jgi:hypothetical protein